VSKTSSEEPPHVFVTCYTCHERMHVPVRKVERKIACPECGRSVRVPGREEYEAHRPKTAAEMVRDVGEYDIAIPTTPVAPELIVHTPYLDVKAHVRRELEPERPKFTFLTGVFTFPWTLDVLPRWIGLSAGLVSMTLVVAVVLAVMGGLPSLQAAPQGGVLAFFVLPLIWLTIWTASYGAACSLAIIEGTAGGNDVIGEWPEPHWKEWAADLFYVAWLAALAAMTAWVVTLPLTLVRPDWSQTQLVLGAFVLLFPFVLVSALEAANHWVPVSVFVFQSLGRHLGTWLLFYFVSSLLFAAFAALEFGLVRFVGVFGIVLACPLLAALVFIQARLIGRLAWRLNS
jgi:hypothetical protein